MGKKSSASNKKTNAMRILDQHQLMYDVLEYDVKDGQIDGVSVADKVNRSVEGVFKTLVMVGASRNYYVAMVPVKANVNMKLVAKHFGEKKIEMIPVKDITKITGYIRGGCSPLGMKKAFKTVIDESIRNIEKIVFSGGKQGLQIEMMGQDLVDVLSCDVTKVTE